MKFLFEVEFFDSLKIMVIATSCQDVVNQCEARIRAFSNHSIRIAGLSQSDILRRKSDYIM
jgi:hypothetical protein